MTVADIHIIQGKNSHTNLLISISLILKVKFSFLLTSDLHVLPRKYYIYTHIRYPPGMRKMAPNSRRAPSTRFMPNQAPPTTTPSQQQVPLSTVSRSMSPAVHTTSTNNTATTEGPILVAYTWEGKTYANKLQVVNLTLGDFKEKMFKRKGSYRWAMNEWRI